MKIMVPKPCHNSAAIEQEWIEVDVAETCENCENFMSLDYDAKNGETVGICKIAFDKDFANGSSIFDAIYNAACHTGDDCFVPGSEFVYKD